MFKNIIIGVSIIIIIAIMGTIIYFKFYPRLEIVEFNTSKPKYEADEEIYFKIEANKRSYYYLFTYNSNDVRKLLYPKDLSHLNTLEPNSKVMVGGFNIVKNPNYKDEKVILVVARNPVVGLRKNMSAKSFTKALQSNKNTTSMNIEGKQEVETSVKYIKIEKPQPKVRIDIHNVGYRVDEDIDIDITSSQGYIHTFEATPTDNITKLDKSAVDDEVVRTYTVAKRPIGRHTITAIYTGEDIDIKPTDFRIEEELIKGEPNYSIYFKNGKDYPYEINWFEVTR